MRLFVDVLIFHSILSNNEVLLLAYVRFIKQENVSQKLLFVKKLITNAK